MSSTHCLALCIALDYNPAIGRAVAKLGLRGYIYATLRETAVLDVRQFIRRTAIQLKPALNPSTTGGFFSSHSGRDPRLANPGVNLFSIRSDRFYKPTFREPRSPIPKNLSPILLG